MLSLSRSCFTSRIKLSVKQVLFSYHYFVAPVIDELPYFERYLTEVKGVLKKAKLFTAFACLIEM
jgi:hypothetical protein